MKNKKYMRKTLSIKKKPSNDLQQLQAKEYCFELSCLKKSEVCFSKYPQQLLHIGNPQYLQTKEFTECPLLHPSLLQTVHALKSSFKKSEALSK